MHLRFNLRTAYESGIGEHPQNVMKQLNIIYQHATPQSISDEWWFWNCENIPEKLPLYLKELSVNPMDFIGLGLDEKTASEIYQEKS